MVTDSNLLLELKKIEEVYLLKLPSEFVSFIEFLQSLDSENPLNALVESTGLQVVGPMEYFFYPHNDFDILKYTHFHDPPEFITFLTEKEFSEGTHLGFYRNSPNEAPQFIAMNSSAKNGQFEIIGKNIFQAVYHISRNKKKLLDCIKQFYNPADVNFECKSFLQKYRKNSVAQLWSNFCLDINLKENGVGYREVPTTKTKLLTTLSNIVTCSDDPDLLKKSKLPLEELVTFCQFANDEGDYGESLELGLNLLAFHPQGEFCQIQMDRINRYIVRLLNIGYILADRKEFSVLIKKHISSGRKTKPLCYES